MVTQEEVGTKRNERSVKKKCTSSVSRSAYAWDCNAVHSTFKKQLRIKIDIDILS